MRAAVFRGIGKPLEVCNVPEPKAEPGGVIVKVHYCGVCGSDLRATQQGAFVVKPGSVLGHEFAGEIVESRAPGWKVGELITAVPNNACDPCRASGHSECKDDLGILCPNNRITGYVPEVPGGFAEYVSVSVSQALRLPKEVSSRQGATVEPLAVGLHAVEKGRVKLGDKVLVIGGGGPIGLAVVAFAKLTGAFNVVVSEYAGIRRNTSLAFGASGTIDPAKDEVASALTRIAGGPPDVIFECVGVQGLLQECINLSAPRPHRRRRRLHARRQADADARRVQGNQRAVRPRLRQARLATGAEPARQERHRSGPMITDVFGLEKLPGEFEALRKPSTQIKLLVSPLQN
jgi:threonine dehydrogenase-like Zn-dependent dehydrogenase